jgi:diguanylate cyclase (GGDEF)-like protein
VGRYGGDEFLAILSGTDQESALKLAEHVRTVVEALGVDTYGERVWEKITISIGVVTATPDAVWNPSQLFTAVDYALYEAKSSGRNCVSLFKLPEVPDQVEAPGSKEREGGSENGGGS